MQQTHPTPPPTVSTISTPKAFRLITGVHSIIVQLVLADLIGVALWTFIGAAIGPPTWWIARGILHIIHASLVLDIGLILLASVCGIGLFRRRTLAKSPDDAWSIPGSLIFLLLAGLFILWLVKPVWMAIPANGVPAVPLEPWTGKMIFIPQGALIAAGLCLFAHLIVWWRSRTDPAKERLDLSRAHPDGTIVTFMDQVYAIYRRNLARFNPPPFSTIKTPTTFYYYQHQEDAPTDTKALPNPEREIYWRDGNLIINRAYIGSKAEQANILLPLVARLLYDCNTPDHLVTSLFWLAHIAEQFWLTSWLLTVPLYVGHKCEQHWHTQERDRVEDRDWFAYVCGQGRRLRKLLRLQLEERTLHHLPDNAIPTLAERIDHLDGLLTKEDQQVQQLLDTLPQAATDSP